MWTKLFLIFYLATAITNSVSWVLPESKIKNIIRSITAILIIALFISLILMIFN